MENAKQLDNGLTILNERDTKRVQGGTTPAEEARNNGLWTEVPGVDPVKKGKKIVPTE